MFHAFELIMRFILNLITYTVEVDGYRFSVLSAIVFFGIAAIFIRVLYWLFHGEN